MDSCGSANENLTFARLAVVHDGFGLIAFTETGSGEEAADMTDYSSVYGLERRTGERRSPLVMSSSVHLRNLG